jgi:hypothetical protein
MTGANKLRASGMLTILIYRTCSGMMPVTRYSNTR